MFSQKEKKAGEVPAYFFDYRIQDKHLLTIFAVQGVSTVTQTSFVPVTYELSISDPCNVFI
jgi:hypothetical protein